MTRVGDEFPEAVRAVVRDELAGLGICTLGQVTEVEAGDQRVGVELVSDPKWRDDAIPLLAPGAPGGDGVGDIPGITPGDEVLVVFTADDVTEMTNRRGTVPETSRRGGHRDVFAVPLGPYMDSDTVPDHEPGERIIAHPNGTMVRLGTDGQPDFRVSHPTGVEIAVDSPADARDESPQTPGEATMTHPSGVGVRATRDGVEVVPGHGGGAAARGFGAQAYGEGEWQADASEQGVQTYREHGDPWRVEAFGDPDRPEEGHRHRVAGTAVEATQVTASGDGSTTTFTLTHGLGSVPASVVVTPASRAASTSHYVDRTSLTASTVDVVYASAPPAGTGNLAWDVVAVPAPGDATAITGAPLAMRELFAWFCVDANFSSLVNSDAPAMQDAQSFYTAYRDWLASETGMSLAPNLPRLGGDAVLATEWPDPEPVPDAATRDSFSPTTNTQ